MPCSSNLPFNFNILTITMAPLLPKMVKIGPKLGPKCHFSSLIQIIFGIFAKISFRTVQTFTMGHSLNFQQKKLMQGEVSRGSRNSPNEPKIAIFSRFKPTCRGIFHKLPLNSVLKSRKVTIVTF